MALKLGTEDKKKFAIASVLGIVALGTVGYTVVNLMGGPAPAPSTPMVLEQPVQSSHTSQPATAGHSGATSGPAAQKLPSASDLDPSLHPEKMQFAETVLYTGNGRNIFSRNSAPSPAALAAAAAAQIEKPIAPVRTGPVVPPPPPPPPPIDLKFYGFATEQNGIKKVFLLHGEDVFVAGEGDIVNRSYRVIQILDRSVVVEDLSYNDKQSLPLQDF